ncbi:unnamed protein product, partial [marine sediment metagenome]
IGNYLNGCGFYETISVAFVDNSAASLFASTGIDEHLSVKDVSRKSVNLLRQSLVGSLLDVLKTNLNAKNTPCRIYELADTFIPITSGKIPVQNTKLSFVSDGDFRQLRGVIEALVKIFDKNAEAVFQPADVVWAGAGAEILVNGKVLGRAGLISGAVKDKFDFKDVNPCAAELDFSAFLDMWG